MVKFLVLPDGCDRLSAYLTLAAHASAEAHLDGLGNVELSKNKFGITGTVPEADFGLFVVDHLKRLPNRSPVAFGEVEVGRKFTTGDQRVYIKVYPMENVLKYNAVVVTGNREGYFNSFKDDDLVTVLPKEC